MRHEKRLRYAEIAREMYKPKIDERKRAEMQSLKQREEAKIQQIMRHQSESNLHKTEVFRV